MSHEARCNANNGPVDNTGGGCCAGGSQTLLSPDQYRGRAIRHTRRVAGSDLAVLLEGRSKSGEALHRDTLPGRLIDIKSSGGFPVRHFDGHDLTAEKT